MGVYFGFSKRVEAVDFGEFSGLAGVYDELVANYDGEIDRDKLVEGAKRGMVEAVGDDYTVFMGRAEAGEFEKSLSGDVGAGVGVEMGERDGWVKVLRTLPDNPARRAGVLAGDIFYKVDGVDVSEGTSDKIAETVRGAEGTEVKLSLVRDGEEVEFVLRREKINNVSAYVEYRGDVAVVVVTRFDLETGGVVRGIADEIVGKGIDRVILDLRGNGGGYVSAAKEVLSLWVDGKVVVVQKGKSGGNEETFATRGGAILAGKKTVVLINGGSASAAEIVAGALKDYGLATLVGEKSYGKGSVQSLVELDGGELLKVTIARWYTPEGKNIDGEGIEPDLVVERSFDDINREVDPQVEAGVEYLE
jgi:carboxyl-terminal processing protease